MCYVYIYQKPMKSKRIIKISLALAIVVGAYIYIDRSQCKSMDLLFQANLEALAGDESSEPVQIPCSAQKKSKCSFSAKDADGNTHSDTWKDSKQI